MNQHVAVVVRSTKGGGIFPLQGIDIRFMVTFFGMLNKGRGNIPPPSCPRQNCSGSESLAQQREGEYSPSKRRGRACRDDTAGLLNKGRGNIPPPRQVPSWMLAGVFHAQQREGEYSPSKTAPLTSLGTLTGMLNKGRGNIPPPSRAAICGICESSVLNKGRGNIPPPRHAEGQVPRVPVPCSTKGGGIFPLQGRGAALIAPAAVCSTKGGGIFPLQAPACR